MRRSSHARSAAQSAPFTPSGVLTRLASNRRAMMVPQREAIGPDVRSTTCFKNAPSSVPKASAGKPPDASEIMPTASRERRAAGGTSYRMINSGSSSSSSSASGSSTLASPGAVGVSEGEVAPDGVPGVACVGLPGGVVGAGAGSPNPSGSKDSGPCWPRAGKEITRTSALATKRPLFEIFSVNDANLFPYWAA